MAAEWFYQATGKTVGPVPAAQLKQLAKAGTVTPDTPVRRNTDGKWVKARRVKGLFETTGTPSPQPPAVSPKGPPPIPPPVPPDRKPPDNVVGGRLRGLRPIHWMAVAGCSIALVVILAGSAFLGGGASDDGRLAKSVVDEVPDTGAANLPPGIAPSRANRGQQYDWKALSTPVAPRPAKAIDSSPPGAPSPADVYANAAPAVVIIRSFRSQEPLGFGSGFVVEPGDIIVTNEHVIRGASYLEIRTHSGETARATAVVAANEDWDVAVLPVPAALRGTASLKLATSVPRIGDPVYAIGIPQGFAFTFTRGVVSQIHNFSKYGMIQHDASISPGSSGGPLVNAFGEVVGVNRLASLAEMRANNLNFAVSSSTIATALRSRQYQLLTELDGYKVNLATKKSPRGKRRKKNTPEPPADAERESDLAIRELGKQLRNQQVSAATEAERTRLNERITTARMELRAIEIGGVHMAEKRLKIVARGRAVAVRLSQIGRRVTVINVQISTLQRAIQTRELAVAGGTIFLDGLNVPFDQSGITTLQSQQVLLQAELSRLIPEGRQLGAVYAGLDMEARGLSRLLERKAAEKSGLTQSLQLLEQQYNPPNIPE